MLAACSRNLKNFKIALSKNTSEVNASNKPRNLNNFQDLEAQFSNLTQPDDDHEGDQTETANSNAERSQTTPHGTTNELSFENLASIPDDLVQIEISEPETSVITPPVCVEEINNQVSSVIFNNDSSDGFWEANDEALRILKSQQDEDFYALQNNLYKDWKFSLDDTISLMSMPSSPQISSPSYSPKSTNSSIFSHILAKSPKKHKSDWCIESPDWCLEKNISSYGCTKKNKNKTAKRATKKNLLVSEGDQRNDDSNCFKDLHDLHDPQDSQNPQNSQDLQPLQESQKSHQPQESQKAHQPQNSQDLSDEFYDTPSTDEESSAGLNNLSEGCYRIIDDNKAGKNTFTIGEKLTQAEIDSEEVGYYFKYNGKEDSKILKSRISLCNNEPENCKENYLKSKGINMKLIEKYDKTESSRGAAKYCPIYVQTICEKTGESIKNKGLCPYCPTSKTDPYKNFYSLHDSSYLHHVTKIHGILRTGKKIPSPIMSGKFIASKSLGPRSKRSKNIAKQAVTCHCKAIVKVKDNDTDPKKQYLAYFRHYLENHYAGVNKSKKHNNCAK